MNLYEILQTSVTLEVLSADIYGIFDGLLALRVPIVNITLVDELTVRIDVPNEYLQLVKKFLFQRGDRIRILKKKGVYWLLQSFIKRPVLITGMIALIVLSILLPTRILFIEVQGNKEISAKEIIEMAENCGIFFGASRTTVRSEKLKNTLLENMPELQWAAINTKGCVAIISVQERLPQKAEEIPDGVCSIVADRDGVITECTIIKGSAQCAVGQAVRLGDVLVSGYNDCGLYIQALHADAEIFAQTKRSIIALRPLDYQYKGDIVAVEKKYSLIFGKNKIKFYKDSGIYNATCDKIYTDYAMMLPGGFQLPVTICVETWIHYDLSEKEFNNDKTVDDISNVSEKYLLSQMVAGNVLERQRYTEISEQLITLKEDLTCHEMIGRVRYEENLISHGKDS